MWLFLRRLMKYCGKMGEMKKERMRGINEGKDRYGKIGGGGKLNWCKY